ncbi:large conductance mechanosensitive channel protein MscL [Halobacillus sp. KGW1]|uniref:large conductance mechanosensitive channel protein MscL n=1 Tax=Halobacillus sp. KGW1 TaxID=1793726 RepID=UPI00078290FD|nr:large conductance mechanosensitive channel protein MscL [Halobacillus sp. KGW1]
MGLLREFKQFAMRGSAVDIGVGMVLGAAFSGFIDSFVKDLLMPPIGLLYHKMDIENMFISLNGTAYSSRSAAEAAGAPTINYGLFLTASVRFLIVLFAVFLVVWQLNRWKKPHQDPMLSMTKKDCPYCCLSIPSQAVICPNCSSSLSKYTKEPPSKWRMK